MGICLHCKRLNVFFVIWFSLHTPSHFLLLQSCLNFFFIPSILEICHTNSCLYAFGHDLLSHASGNFSFYPPSSCPSSNMTLKGLLVSSFPEPVFSFKELDANVFQSIFCFTLLAIVVDLLLQLKFRFLCQSSFIFRYLLQ